MLIVFRRAHVAEMFAHAREAEPAECCGLVGGRGARARTIYRLLNVAREPQTAYEAAPAELFAAQRSMRARGEELLAIYHSHPRAPEPVPSETDVRLAFYPAALYLIIGLGGADAVLRAYHISEREKSWARVEYRIAEE